MTRVIVVGSIGTASAELTAALRAFGAVLIVQDKLPPFPGESFELAPPLLVDDVRLPPPERPQFYPETRPKLPNWSISRFPHVRTGKRPREHRTRK